MEKGLWNGEIILDYLSAVTYIFIRGGRDFSGGPVVKMPSSQGRDPGSISGQGTWSCVS